jgi:hypothetical protein
MRERLREGDGKRERGGVREIGYEKKRNRGKERGTETGKAEERGRERKREEQRKEQRGGEREKERESEKVVADLPKNLRQCHTSNMNRRTNNNKLGQISKIIHPQFFFPSLQPPPCENGRMCKKDDLTFLNEVKFKAVIPFNQKHELIKK